MPMHNATTMTVFSTPILCIPFRRFFFLIKTIVLPQLDFTETFACGATLLGFIKIPV
jgi:hypothetical protein